MSNRVVLITGGSRGIGRATAQHFAEQGDTVVINFRADETAATRTLNTLRGEKHAAIRADLTDPESAAELIEAVTEHYGRLDVLVNNAGGYDRHPPLDTSYQDWQRHWKATTELNLLAPVNLMYLAGHHMARHGGGRIVNVSSRGAFRGEPLAPAYAAAKAGLNAAAQSMAKALGGVGVFITCVAPGFVETDMARRILDSPEGEEIRAQSSLGRVARPEEVARAIYFLASGNADFCTGAILDINGASYLR